MLPAVWPLGVLTAAAAVEAVNVNAATTAAAKMVRPCIELLQTESGRPALPSPSFCATVAGFWPTRIGLDHSVTGATLAHPPPICQDQYPRTDEARPDRRSGRGSPSIR